MDTDEELVARLAAGDDGALVELLRRYDRSLSGFLYRRNGGREVEDLYQETWIRVVGNAHRFDPSRRFSTWLFQIALNLCRDWQRRQAAELAPAAGPAAATDDGIDREIDAARLLQRLPEEQRDVVILRYYHDLAEREVADILGIPPGTVKSRMHNAVKAMAAIVERETK